MAGSRWLRPQRATTVAASTLIDRRPIMFRERISRSRYHDHFRLPREPGGSCYGSGVQYEYR